MAQAQAITMTKPSGNLTSDKLQFWLGLLIIFGTVLIPDFMGNQYYTHTFQLVNLYIGVAILQNILFVDAGQVAFGMGAIFGLGAYVAGIATGMHGLSYEWGIVLGTLAATLGGVLFALPALRVQHFHLGFVTLAAAMVFPEMLVAMNKYTNGINGIPMPTSALTQRLPIGLAPLSLVIAAFSGLMLVLHVRMRRTKLGRRMMVAAASPEAAQSLGTSPGAMRSIAFILVSALTGLAGTLYPPIVGFVSPSAFNLDLSILFFFAVVVGGRGQPLGPILGVYILYLVPNVLLVQFVNFRLMAYGAVALAAMLAFPDGIIGSLEIWRRKRQLRPEDDGALRVDRIIANAETEFTDKPLAPDAERPVLVEVHDGRKSFGNVRAIDGVNLTVRQGEIHGLVGANGSGKTSLLNVLSGLSRLDSGSLSVKGRDITRMAPHRIARLGLGRTFQAPRIFPALSIWGNLEIGIDGRYDKAEEALPVRVQALKEALSDRSAEYLPHGQRRIVEVMRVVLKEADILMLDEPAAGLSPEERAEFSHLLRVLSRQMGKTIILVEHDLDLVWGVADKITVLDFGRVVASGDPAEVATMKEVHHMFVGKKHA